MNCNLSHPMLLNFTTMTFPKCYRFLIRNGSEVVPQTYALSRAADVLVQVQQ